MANKTVLITGASKGIGYETAKYFAEKGWNVGVNYNKNSEKALELVDFINSNGGNAIGLKADVMNKNQVKDMFLSLWEKYKTIDCLVNNAGISQQKLFTDLSENDVSEMLDINLKGQIFCAQESCKYMLKNHSGSIINISSIYGMNGGACEVHYSASKAGVIGLTKALAKEMVYNGIRVNCVAPGAVDTDMNEHLSDSDRNLVCEEIPMGRMALPNEIAKIIYFFADDVSSYITGEVLSPNGGSDI